MFDKDSLRPELEQVNQVDSNCLLKEVEGLKQELGSIFVVDEVVDYYDDIPAVASSEGILSVKELGAHKVDKKNYLDNADDLDKDWKQNKMEDSYQGHTLSH